MTALCSPAGKAITGQLLGVRGREVFLFGQPRPVARLEVEAPATLAQDLSAKLSDRFTDLTTVLRPSTPNLSLRKAPLCEPITL